MCYLFFYFFKRNYELTRVKPGKIDQNFKRETVSKEELVNNSNKYLYEIIGSAKHIEDEFLIF